MTARFLCLTLVAGLAGAGLSSCSSMTSDKHGGIRYSIAPSDRPQRVEKGKEGRYMYDSPDLTVISENGQLNINGRDSGPVRQGDEVEITHAGAVSVNGESRGDFTINQQAPQRVEYTVK